MLRRLSGFCIRAASRLETAAKASGRIFGKAFGLRSLSCILTALRLARQTSMEFTVYHFRRLCQVSFLALYSSLNLQLHYLMLSTTRPDLHLAVLDRVFSVSV